MVPYRHMDHWGRQASLHHQAAQDLPGRGGQPSWMGSPTTGEDPRLSAQGDVARHGTIPDYVPYAVLNPGVAGQCGMFPQ